MRRASFIFGLMVWATCAEYAFACSVGEDFVRPSNFELVQLADAIVVAKPVEQTKKATHGYQVRFDVSKSLKGEAPQAVYDMRARISKIDPSDPGNLSSAHPEAYNGPCTRMTYDQDGEYVLFLNEDDDGTFVVGGHAFSRINEDYYGPDSLWATTIQYYLEVQQNYEPMEQLQVLRTRFDELISGKPILDDMKKAKDIADHLRSRSPYKPTEFLVQTYRALEDRRELPFAVRSPEADKEGSEADVLTELVFGPTRKRDFDVGEQKLFVLWSLVNGDHPDASPLFEELASRTMPPGALIGVSSAFFVKHLQYRRAIDLVKEHAFRIMSTSPRHEVGHFLRGVSRLQDDGLWLATTYSREWWPEFAMAVHASHVARFGSDARFVFRFAAHSLRPENYRDRPNVALTLADFYEDDVVKWASDEIDRLFEVEEKGYSDAFSLPVGVLLVDYTTRKPERIKKVFCTSDNGRYVVLKYLGLHQQIYTEKLAFQLAALNLDEEETETLLQSLYLYAANDRKEYLTGGGWGWGDADDLIGKILRKEQIDLAGENLEPLTCSERKSSR